MNREFYRRFIMLCPFYLFLICFNSFRIFDFFLRQLVLKFVRRCFGRLDGSMRALRKIRFRNETDNFIESISQMVPRWSPEVPDGPQRSPKPITSCGRPPKPITCCGWLRMREFYRDFVINYSVDNFWQIRVKLLNYSSTDSN